MSTRQTRSPDCLSLGGRGICVVTDELAQVTERAQDSSHDVGELFRCNSLELLDRTHTTEAEHSNEQCSQETHV